MAQQLGQKLGGKYDYQTQFDQISQDYSQRLVPQDYLLTQIKFRFQVTG